MNTSHVHTHMYTHTHTYTCAGILNDMIPFTTADELEMQKKTVPVTVDANTDLVNYCRPICLY